MLFRILEGDSSRISTDITPFHKGWCYFTTDDGKFYIDSENNGTQKRVCINPNSDKYVKLFAASDWVDGELTIPASEHNMVLSDGNVVYIIYSMDGTKFTTQSLCVMDTEVSVTSNKSVVLSYPGTGYAGKVLLAG